MELVRSWLRETRRAAVLAALPPVAALVVLLVASGPSRLGSLRQLLEGPRVPAAEIAAGRSLADAARRGDGGDGAAAGTAVASRPAAGGTRARSDARRRPDATPRGRDPVPPRRPTPGPPAPSAGGGGSAPPGGVPPTPPVPEDPVVTATRGVTSAVRSAGDAASGTLPAPAGGAVRDGARAAADAVDRTVDAVTPLPRTGR